MGIGGLNDFFRQNTPDVFVKKPLISLRGVTIAIDGNFMVYRLLAISVREILNGMQDPIEGEIDDDVIIATILKKFLRQEMEFKYAEIETIWVFDGETPDAKKLTRETRAKSRAQSRAKYLELRASYINYDFSKGTIEDRIKLRAEVVKSRANTTAIPSGMNDRLIAQMRQLGVAVTRARGEGELHCASFCICRMAKYVYTTDTDVLAIGASIITNVAEGHAEIVEVEKVRENLMLNQEEFRDFCILLGCDFNKKLYRVNAFKTWELVMQGKRIENIPVAMKQDSLNFVESRLLLTPYQINDDEIPESNESRLEGIKNYIYGDRPTISIRPM